jgi:hypothetical protein
MRARTPDREGVVQRNGVRVAFEVFGHFPLGHHFEQNFHVHYRLDRYGAGQCMNYATTDPDLIAAHITGLAGQPVSYRGVETDGAARAARLVAELI